MKVYFTLLLVLLFNFYYNCFCSADVPFLIWSSESLFTEKRVELENGITTTQVNNLMRDLIPKINQGEHSVLENYFNNANSNELKVDVIVFFIEKTLRGDEISRKTQQLSSIHDAISTSENTLITNGILEKNQKTFIDNSILETIAKSIDPTAELILTKQLETQHKNTKILPIEKVMEIISNKDSSIFTNNVEDVIVVEFGDEGLEKDNEVIKTIEEVLKKNGKHISILSAANAEDVTKGIEYEFPRVVKEGVLERSFYETLDNDTSPTSPIAPYSPFAPIPGSGKSWFDRHFPGWFWEVTIVVVFLLIILFVGMSCMIDIRTPDQFPTIKKRAKIE